jgi:H+/Cl- antiporter ClcA
VVGYLLWYKPLWVGRGDVLNGLVLRTQRRPGGSLSCSSCTGCSAHCRTGSYGAGTTLDPTAFASIGMATFFTGAVRAPLTGAILIRRKPALLPTLAACGTAVAVASLLRGQPIYDRRRLRRLRDAALASPPPRPMPK